MLDAGGWLQRGAGDWLRLSAGGRLRRETAGGFWNDIVQLITSKTLVWQYGNKTSTLRLESDTLDAQSGRRILK